MANRTFQQRVSDVIRSTKSQRDNLQALVVEAINHASENNNDFTNLSYLVRSCIGVRSLNTKAMMGYIGAHVSGIRWAKQKDGKHGYRKASKKAKVSYKTPEGNWYDFQPDGTAKKPEPYDMDKCETSITRSLSRLFKEAQADPARVQDMLHKIAEQAAEIAAKANEAKANAKAKS